jgi:hypothetical protein
MSRGKILSVAVAALALAYFAPAAEAGTLKIKDTSYRIGVGGEFNITDITTYYLPPADAVADGIVSGDAGNFKTFCLEKNEFITLGSQYTFSIDTIAKNGGVGGRIDSLGGDPIGETTAKLYYAFYSGQLTGYDYTTDSGRGIDGGDLQHAIWRLEQELTDTQWNNYSGKTQAQAFIDFATNATWASLGQIGWDGIGGVKVMNLYDAAGNAKQSQLMVVPLPPAALMGLALLAGVGGVMGLRRRRLARRLV